MTGGGEEPDVGKAQILQKLDKEEFKEIMPELERKIAEASEAVQS